MALGPGMERTDLEATSIGRRELSYRSRCLVWSRLEPEGMCLAMLATSWQLATVRGGLWGRICLQTLGQVWALAWSARSLNSDSSSTSRIPSPCDRPMSRVYLALGLASGFCKFQFELQWWVQYM